MLQTRWIRIYNDKRGGNWMMRFARLALAGLLVIAGSGIARADDLRKAKIGVLRMSSSAPVFIAQDKGYFRDAGLDIELRFFDAAQPIAVATTSGDVDFGITAFTAGLYNLAGKGTLKVIGGMSREKAGYPLIGYFASNTAYAAGLKTPKDLARKRVAVTQIGSSFHYSLGLLADKYGFKLADVKVLPLQSLSNAAAALKGETVDAALLPVSTARKLMDDGGAKLLGWVGDETPWQLGAVFASPKTLADKPLVTKLLVALARADREYHDVILAAVADGKAPINESTKPLLEIIAKYTNLPVEQVVDWQIGVFRDDLQQRLCRQSRCWRSSRNTPICQSTTCSTGKLVYFAMISSNGFVDSLIGALPSATAARITS